MREVGTITTPTRGIAAGSRVEVEPEGDGIHLYVINEDVSPRQAWDIWCDSAADAEERFSKWSVAWAD